MLESPTWQRTFSYNDPTYSIRSSRGFTMRSSFSLWWPRRLPSWGTSIIVWQDNIVVPQAWLHSDVILAIGPPSDTSRYVRISSHMPNYLTPRLSMAHVLWSVSSVSVWSYAFTGLRPITCSPSNMMVLLSKAESCPLSGNLGHWLELPFGACPDSGSQQGDGLKGCEEIPSQCLNTSERLRHGRFGYFQHKTGSVIKYSDRTNFPTTLLTFLRNGRTRCVIL